MCKSEVFTVAVVKSLWLISLFFLHLISILFLFDTLRHQALLEKAMRARQAQLAEEAINGVASSPERAPKLKKEPSVKVPQGLPAGATPNFLAPTKAFQVQSVPVKFAQQVILTDEDLVRQEQEKRDHIAAIRRKFKEQHKKILNALKKKNDDESKKVCLFLNALRNLAM